MSPRKKQQSLDGVTLNDGANNELPTSDSQPTECKKDKKYVETPLMKQYYEIKAKHPDAILLFRVGDFYETFGEDAIKASGILGITLTRRANGAASYVELAGFPYHALDNYMPKLVRAGERVAICEQLEDPKLTKKIVKRGVIEMVTPGVVMGENLVAGKENTFLASVYFGKKTTGAAFLDLSTGEFYVTEGDDAYIDKIISNLRPKEILHQRGSEERFYEAFGKKHYTYRLEEWIFAENVNREKLCRQFGVQSLKGFGIEDMSAGISAAGATLYYLEFTEHRHTAHIASIARIERGESVWIDRFTMRNLELFTSNSSNSKSSFMEVIDRTLTPMGGRQLKRWIAFPLMDIEKIRMRQDIVESITKDIDFAEALRNEISSIGDLERIASRIAAERVTPRELIQLKQSLSAIELLRALMEGTDNEAMHRYAEILDPLVEVRQRLERDIYPDPENNQIQKGGIIADGLSAELDDLRRISLHGKEYLHSLQQRESEITGIPSLKVGYNNVFGYYLEVRNTHKDKVPENWIRKQTLTGAERYITQELKEYEQKIMGAEERILQIEAELYAQLVAFIATHLATIQRDAQVVARMDCLQSLAKIATERRYVRPIVDDSTIIDIREGRHPVIESLMMVGEEYIPNDVKLTNDEQQIIIITGPNMSGKSALLRQTALIVLMAQMGSFVPAKSAHIGIVDKIFTRVGASDNLAEGESTFMVEMLESANILNNISPRSLVLLDEIGRGTSTYDGISIAWAMVEYLHNNQHGAAKTLFATHYHELNELENMLPRVKNYHVTVKEVDKSIIFLRKLERGGTEHSFGIHVARMSGMPRTVVQRAEDILANLEKVYGSGEIVPTGELRKRGKSHNVAASAAATRENIQLSMFQLDDPVLIAIRDQIKGIDINSLTPIEALNKLDEIKRIAGI